MPLRLTPALCILLLAGCTSSEPQNVSYAPVVEQPATVVGAPTVPAAYDQMGQTPQGVAGPAVLQPGCSTVDNVTLCDAPSDPSVDETHYTN
jgi:hypothetical protein